MFTFTCIAFVEIRFTISCALYACAQRALHEGKLTIKKHLAFVVNTCVNITTNEVYSTCMTFLVAFIVLSCLEFSFSAFVIRIN